MRLTRPPGHCVCVNANVGDTMAFFVWKLLIFRPGREVGRWGNGPAPGHCGREVSVVQQVNHTHVLLLIQAKSVSDSF